MRNYYQTITIACCMAMSASPLAIWAQSGDEQGLEIPRNLQLQQDKDELRKAYDGWWTASQKNKEQRMSWYNEAKFGCFIHWGPYSVPAGLGKQDAERLYRTPDAKSPHPPGRVQKRTDTSFQSY